MVASWREKVSFRHEKIIRDFFVRMVYSFVLFYVYVT